MIILEPRALVGDKNAANGKLSPVPVSQNLTRRKNRVPKSEPIKRVHKNVPNENTATARELEQDASG
jgi:hypothetical protein